MEKFCNYILYSVFSMLKITKETKIMFAENSDESIYKNNLSSNI